MKTQCRKHSPLVEVVSVELFDIDEPIDVYDIEVPEDESFQSCGIVLHNSKLCASRDGTRYKVGSNHPSPPAHPNCRSVLAPSFSGEVMGQRPYVRSLKVKGNDDNAKFRPIGKMTQKQREEAELKVGQVAASTNYSKWFGNQPASFQREWLGESRYRLYRDGGYTIDRFVDPIKGELTLDQLRQRDAATFAELFG